MKRFILIMVVFMATISIYAQSDEGAATTAFRFGAISRQKVIEQMPDYQRIDADMAALKEKYDAEMKSAENEFNAKYEIFLAEQRNYAPAILRKRQSELEDLMKRNEAFRLESLRLLEQAHADMLRPVEQKIDKAIAQISQLYQLAFVLNTDSDAVPYLNPAMAYNITDAVIVMLTEE